MLANVMWAHADGPPVDKEAASLADVQHLGSQDNFRANAINIDHAGSFCSVESVDLAAPAITEMTFV